jgi:flagellar export protein FliJ
MAIFEFPLEKVLRWRQKQQDVEAARLGRLQYELKDLERALAQVCLRRDASQQELLARGELKGRDLAALEAYKMRLGTERQRIEQHILEQRRKLTEQQARYLEARRSARLLEKLRERRLKQWRSEQNTELETLATEAFLSRWVREKGRSRTQASAKLERHHF